jgi:channel protein (hemolysin III family)
LDFGELSRVEKLTHDMSSHQMLPTVVPIPGFADPVSSLSHLAGAAIFLVLSYFLLRRGAGNAARVASLLVFCFGAVFLLSISGVYHLLTHDETARRVLRALDHAAIFVLIASTFTPIHVILFRGPGRWGMLLLIWAIAIVSITLKIAYLNSMPDQLGTALYLGMGWIGLASGIALARRFNIAFVAPVLWGGVAYSIGAVLDSLRWPVLVPGVVQWHEVFHVAVLVGLAYHWSFIYRIADGRLAPCPLAESLAGEGCSAPTNGR